MTLEKLIKVADYIIEEPDFNSDPNRCYRLPFIACELFTSDVPAVTKHLLNELPSSKNKKKHSSKMLIEIFQNQEYPVLAKILSFFNKPAHWYESKQLNVTLGGYVSKILSFWLIKRPAVILIFLEQ